MLKPLLFFCLPTLLTAATLPEARQALASGNNAAAVRLCEAIRAETGSLSEDWAEATLVLAEAQLKQGNAGDADTTLRRLSESPGADDRFKRAASAARIKAVKGPVAQRKLCRDFLQKWPIGPDTTPVRLLLARLIEAEEGAEKAYAFLRDRAAQDKGSPYDSPVAQEEARLKASLAAPASGSGAAGKAALAKAEALFAKPDFPAAAKAFEAITAPGHPGEIRMTAFARQLLAMEAAGLGGDAARLVSTGITGVPTDTFPSENLVLFARLRLDYAQDAPSAEIFARKALAALKPEGAEAENARWLLARALARQGRDRADIIEAVKDSPLVRDCAFPPDSPYHPVTRLVAASANLDRWIEADLHQSAPAGATPTLRAADECFAATRFADAAKLYARAAKEPAANRDIRAYATLQQARALAQLRQNEKVMATYRRFLTEKELTTSAYAPAALLRAGVFAAGPLRSPKDALPFYETAFREHPRTEDGETAAIYRIAILEIISPAKVRPAIEAYLKARPDGRFVADMRKKLLPKTTTPKTQPDAKK